MKEARVESLTWTILETINKLKINELSFLCSNENPIPTNEATTALVAFDYFDCLSFYAIPRT